MIDNKKEIINILPKIGEIAEQYKSIAPRMVMRLFEDAIKEKYAGDLSAFITETSRINDKDEKEVSLSYSFYLVAFIGNGYNYKLFEVVPLTNEKPYPVDLMLFDKQPTDAGKFFSDKELSDRLKLFFQSSFINRVVNNLVAQVQLFRENNKIE